MRRMRRRTRRLVEEIVWSTIGALALFCATFLPYFVWLVLDFKGVV